MRIRCIQLLDARGKATSSSVWLKLGAEYDVLSLSFEYSSGRTRVMLVGEHDNKPGLFPLSQFEIIEGSIPTNWKVHVLPSGAVTIGPASWMVPDFWERFFDRDIEAEAAFTHEKLKMGYQPGGSVSS